MCTEHAVQLDGIVAQVVPCTRGSSVVPDKVASLAVLVLGSLHQKPRVGGPPSCLRRDGSDGWRSPVPKGRQHWGAISCTSSANRCCLARRQVANVTMPCGRCTSWSVLLILTLLVWGQRRRGERDHDQTASDALSAMTHVWTLSPKGCNRRCSWHDLQ